MGLAIDWFRKTPDPEDKKAFEQAIRHAGPVLAVLKELVDERRAAVSRSREQDYDSPSWAYLQAHKNGQMDILEYISKLTTIKD